jgi:hypothetical protein
MAKVEKNETLIALEDSMSKVDKELEPEVWAQMFKDADTLRRKLQTRARFMISAEGGGPGGGQKAGGGWEPHPQTQESETHTRISSLNA